MTLLLVIGGIILALILGGITAYYLKPELLVLPYSTFIGFFISNPPFVDKNEHFPNSVLLEENWVRIREELLEVLKNADAIPKFHEVDSIQRFISGRDDIPWRSFGIKAFDSWVEPNASMVPFTTGLLQQMPEVTLAMFSILDPGKRIPRHFGFFKGIFRYHLALIVPNDGECYIICGGQKYFWKEGEGVLFDDTFIHEVWNNTQNRRVVLFMDIYRDNSLPKWIRPLNHKMTKLLAGSQRIQKAVKKAEVTVPV